MEPAVSWGLCPMGQQHVLPPMGLDKWMGLKAQRDGDTCEASEGYLQKKGYYPTDAWSPPCLSVQPRDPT